jgi:outer membrane receptor for Fe3+-dicitrate
MHRSLFSSAGIALASLAAVTPSAAQPATVLSPVEVEAPPRPAAKPRVPRSGNEAGRPEARHVAAPTLGAGGMSVTPGASAAQTPVASASEKNISGAEVNARPLSRPAEALEVAPGLIVTQHSGDGKANQYFLRGVNLDHGTDLAIFIDGMPVNMRTHGHRAMPIQIF